MLLGYLARSSVTVVGSFARAKLRPLDEARLPFTVWPGDIDVYGHVNNGRYLTLMDQGRLDYVLRTGLFAQMTRRGWRPILAAATVRFRRELKPLVRCDLVTRLSYWDAKWFFFEQRFEKDGQVHATGFVQGVVKAGRQTVTPQEMMASVGFEDAPPGPSAALAAWLQALEAK